MSTNSQVYLDLKQPKITNSRKMDKWLEDIIAEARENRKSRWDKLVDKLRRR